MEKLEAHAHGDGGTRLRRAVVAALVVLGCVLTPLAATSIWLRNQVTDDDRYVRTIEPLASDPAIQAAVAAEVTTALFARVDVAAEAERALPERARFLAVPIAAGVRNYAEQAALRVLESERFQQLWVEINRLSHQQLVKVLTGGGDFVQTTDGTVALNLAPVVDAVEAELAQRGVTLFERVPEDAVPTSFTLMESAALERAQRGFRLLETLAFVLPVLVVALFTAAIAVSRRRRRTVLQVALGVAASIVVLGAALMAGRAAYVSEVTDAGLPEDAAVAFFDIVVQWLRIGIRAIFGVAVLVALGAFLTGPSRAAVAVRSRFGRAVDSSADRTGVRTSSTGRWVAANKRALRIAAIAVPAVVFVFWTAPTPAVLVILVVLALLALLAIEVLAGSDDTPPAGAAIRDA